MDGVVMDRTWGLDGATVVITGASSGIGAELARGFLDAGCTVVGVSRSPRSSDHDSFHPLAVDLTDREATLRAIETLNTEFGPIDVLINNAGTAPRGESVDYSIDEWDRIIELNLTAPFLLSRGLAPAMLARGKGKVLFTASLWSFLGGWQVPAYTVTKSGVAGLIRALSNEWSPHGVQVNGIAPGYVDTDLTRPVIEDPERAPRYLSRIPTGRWGQPSDIVGAALFLASSHADYITGTILPVDGGWLAQ